MTELKPCGACGITGIHACLGPPIVTNDLMLIQTLTKRIAELEGIPAYVFTRRPFRPMFSDPTTKEIYKKGFEDALIEVECNIKKLKEQGK
mgnify:CR=1 FL=1|tara:strand:- start:156 stop:428 length:273 start_codon:yes stop_codon:yes gene_type:complete